MNMELQGTGENKPKESPRPPYVSGSIWSETVADYILEVYPEFFESGLNIEDMYPLLLGKTNEDTWY